MHQRAHENRRNTLKAAAANALARGVSPRRLAIRHAGVDEQRLLRVVNALATEGHLPRRRFRPNRSIRST